MRLKLSAGSLTLLVILFFIACSSQQNESATSSSTTVGTQDSTKNETTSAAVRDVSELAELMREMHAELRDARKFIKTEEEVPDSIWSDFAHLVTAKSTKGMVKDPTHFNGYAQVFLTRVSELKENPDVAKYNAVIDNCLACHQQYCQGPIPKIKKLTLPVEAISKEQ